TIFLSDQPRDGNRPIGPLVKRRSAHSTSLADVHLSIGGQSMRAINDFLDALEKGQIKARPTPTRTLAPAANNPAPSTARPPDAACAPDATSTVMFFCWDSADLTGSDKQSLDAYVKAYLAAKNPPSINVEGWASSEGNKKHNDDLSDQR